MRRKKSKEEAKNRLVLVLECEREGLPPSILQALKEDFIQVLRKYRYFDEKHIAVGTSVTEDGRSVLRIEIPIALR